MIEEDGAQEVAQVDVDRVCAARVEGGSVARTKDSYTAKGCVDVELGY